MSGLLLSSSLALKKKKPTMLADSTTPSRSPSPERAMNKNVKVRRREGNGDLVFFLVLFEVHWQKHEKRHSVSTRQRGFAVQKPPARAKIVFCSFQRKTELGKGRPSSEQ